MPDQLSETHWNGGRFDDVLQEHEHDGEPHKHPGGFYHPHWHQRSGAAVYWCGCVTEDGLSYPKSNNCPYVESKRS